MILINFVSNTWNDKIYILLFKARISTCSRRHISRCIPLILGHVLCNTWNFHFYCFFKAGMNLKMSSAANLMILRVYFTGFNIFSGFSWDFGTLGICSKASFTRLSNASFNPHHCLFMRAAKVLVSSGETVHLRSLAIAMGWVPKSNFLALISNINRHR